MSSKEPIGVLGAGWVGLVTAACFAELGHSVIVRDVVPERIADLEAGRVPIYEPGLEELIAKNRERLRFTLSIEDVFAEAKLAFVCVGTPSTYSGDADLTAVWHVLDELPEFEERALLVMKSTVPVGTGEKVRHELNSRGLAHVGYVSNPEFLAEGTAVANFMEPDRVAVGAFADADGDTVAALYEPLGAPVVRTDVASAEMIKLASNAFLMTRISFINEIANVCELVGADVAQVAEGVGLDHRLGPAFPARRHRLRRVVLPQGFARAQAARGQLWLPLPAPLRGDRGQRAAEAPRRREARQASRPAPGEDRRAARARVQAEHGRPARGAEPRARVAAARRRGAGARVGPGRARRREAPAQGRRVLRDRSPRRSRTRTPP